MEFESRDLKELWELLKTRRYRRLAVALVFPVLLIVFLIYTPERYDAYLVGAIFTLGGLHTVLKGEVLVKWAGGTEEVVEGCFARDVGILTFGVGIAILVYAL